MQYAPRDPLQRARLTKLESLVSQTSSSSMSTKESVRNLPTTSSSGSVVFEILRAGGANDARTIFSDHSLSLSDPMQNSDTTAIEEALRPTLGDTPSELTARFERQLKKETAELGELRSAYDNYSSLSDKINEAVSCVKEVSSHRDNAVKAVEELSKDCDRLRNEYNDLIEHAEGFERVVKFYSSITKGAEMLGLTKAELEEVGNYGSDATKAKATNGAGAGASASASAGAGAGAGASAGAGAGTVGEEKKISKDSLPTVSDDQVKVQIGGDAYANMLEGLDESYKFFLTTGRGYYDGSKYLTKSEYLHGVSCVLLKQAFVDRVESTRRQVVEGGVDVTADKLEASIIYTKFYGISSSSKNFYAFLSRRSKAFQSKIGKFRWNYIAMMEDCRAIYCDCRLALLRPVVGKHIEGLFKQHGLVGMTRVSSVFLARLCRNETSLYNQFFGGIGDGDGDVQAGEGERKKGGGDEGGDDIKDRELVDLLFKLCSDLHSAVRKGLVKVNDLDTLCEIVSVLRDEEGGGAAGVKNASAATMSHVIKDAQERLIFCSQSTLQKEVTGFKITPESVDFPNKLLAAQEAVAIATESGDIGSQMELVYGAWYPPLKSTLAVLSKIYRVVEMSVFDDFAAVAVKECSEALRKGCEAVKGNNAGAVDSQLFLIKHLLLLREQLVPFDISLRSVSRELDFSRTGEAFTRFLNTSKQKLFSVNLADNSLVRVGRDVVGTVTEVHTDGQRTLEEDLKNVCNEFINSVAETMTGDVETIHVNIIEEGMLRTVVESMRVYLDDDTVQILVNPIKRKIVNCLSEQAAGIDGDEGLLTITINDIKNT